jgi:hypothetical protein
VSKALAITEALHAGQEPRASTTDAEARVMQLADGGFRPADNVPFAADTESGAEAGAALDNSGSNRSKTAMSDALAEACGRWPGRHLADGGFARLGDSAALPLAGVETFAPVAVTGEKTRDRHQPRPDDAPEVVVWRRRMPLQPPDPPHRAAPRGRQSSHPAAPTAAIGIAAADNSRNPPIPAA